MGVGVWWEISDLEEEGEGGERRAGEVCGLMTDAPYT